ncbi:hypothetical protein GCM10027037_15170 [Mucilaginibacter koreensis]
MNGEAYEFYELQPLVAVKGLVLLLPAAGEKPNSIFKKTQLPHLLAAKGYVVIAPKVHTLLYADDYSIEVLNQIITAQTQKYQVTNYMIGGLSSGGAVATRYAECVIAKGNSSALKGLIVIDAPLDLERIYHSGEREINYPCAGIIKQQGYQIKTQLDGACSGPPAQRQAKYIQLSAYTASAADGGNARYLKHLPVRWYTEPDLNFVRKTYCQDMQLADLNSTDLESLNAFLQKAGNTQSTYIATQGRGFHSWNIIDATECATWMESTCK